MWRITHLKLWFIAASAVAIAMVWTPAAAAQVKDYPVKPVRLINPFAPGGPVDFVGRSVGQELSKIWGQPVVVDNRPGAGTTLGAGLVARATPDGYTLLVTSVSTVVAASVYPNLPFDAAKDLAPVAVVAQTPLMFGVHPSVAAKSVQEFVTLAKSKPGQVRYGSAGQGTITHLSGELFKSLAKIDLVHVPYKGGAPSVAATTAGEVQSVFDQSAALLPHVKAGKLRALGVTSIKRVDIAPDVPTFVESGVAGFEVIVWNAILAPAGTPRAIVESLNAHINRVLGQTELRERLGALGLTPAGGSVAEFSTLYKREVARWAKVSKEAGVKIE
ncbi:MAG TPA: tripartite tricarboxylate transporter substrate binding protein [Burkholderiales bacterium]|nr:tripartite tricarboxylate transporter substrate binding protein [Burkholderiales bacterium]